MESEKVKVAQLCPDSLWSHGLYSPWMSPGLLEWVAVPFSRRSSQPRDRTQVCLALQADSLWAEPAEKPMINGSQTQKCTSAHTYTHTSKQAHISIIWFGWWLHRRNHLSKFLRSVLKMYTFSRCKSYLNALLEGKKCN